MDIGNAVVSRDIESLQASLRASRGRVLLTLLGGTALLYGWYFALTAVVGGLHSLRDPWLQFSRMWFILPIALNMAAWMAWINAQLVTLTFPVRRLELYFDEAPGEPDVHYLELQGLRRSLNLSRFYEAIIGVMVAFQFVLGNYGLLVIIRGGL